jgi:hypothetical protein
MRLDLPASGGEAALLKPDCQLEIGDRIIEVICGRCSSVTQATRQNCHKRHLACNSGHDDSCLALEGGWHMEFCKDKVEIGHSG